MTSIRRFVYGTMSVSEIVCKITLLSTSSINSKVGSIVLSLGRSSEMVLLYKINTSL
jgi:hypothetical protein